MHRIPTIRSISNKMICSENQDDGIPLTLAFLLSFIVIWIKAKQDEDVATKPSPPLALPLGHHSILFAPFPR